MSAISLCMIVKNEEDCLGHCLESVRDHVDEIIVVDTGSTDRTVEIAKSYGDRIAEWVYASILEQREKLRAFSSYYTGKESLEILDKIRDTGFQSDEMERRRQLIRMRFRMDVPSSTLS